MYHVGLALTTDQVKKLRQLALKEDLSVKDLVTKLVVNAIEEKTKNKEEKK